MVFSLNGEFAPLLLTKLSSNVKFFVFILIKHSSHRFGDLFWPAIEVLVLAASFLIVYVAVYQSLGRNEEDPGKNKLLITSTVFNVK